MYLLWICSITDVDGVFKICGSLGLIQPELRDGVFERIVHHGIEFVSAQPWHGIVPNFTENVQVGIELFHSLAKRAAELMGDLIGHVQTQSVNAEIAHPVFTDSDQIIDDGRIVGVQFGHECGIGKRIKFAILGAVIRGVKRPLIDHEPIKIRRLRAVLKHILPLWKFMAAVIEYAVEHDADSLLMSGVNQFAQGSFIAERWVNAKVIRGVVFVRSGGGKKWA